MLPSGIVLPPRATCPGILSRAAGLILVSPDGKHRAITKGSDLYPVIVDRVHVRLWKDGKSKGGRIPAADLTPCC